MGESRLTLYGKKEGFKLTLYNKKREFELFILERFNRVIINNNTQINSLKEINYLLYILLIFIVNNSNAQKYIIKYYSSLN